MINQEDLDEIRSRDDWSNGHIAASFNLNIAQVYAIRDAARVLKVDDAKLLASLPLIDGGMKSHEIKQILLS